MNPIQYQLKRGQRLFDMLPDETARKLSDAAVFIAFSHFELEIAQIRAFVYAARKRGLDQSALVCIVLWLLEDMLED